VKFCLIRRRAFMAHEGEWNVIHRQLGHLERIQVINGVLEPDPEARKVFRRPANNGLRHELMPRFYLRRHLADRGTTFRMITGIQTRA
jgi:hypothetical protein